LRAFAPLAREMAIASRQSRCYPPEQLCAFLGRRGLMGPFRIDLAGHHRNLDELTFIAALKELVPPRRQRQLETSTDDN
jgi:hypothetical protein